MSENNIYGKALKEVNEILENMEDKYTSKIPSEFIKLIIENCDWDYDFTYDTSKSLEEQNILEETKAILAIIYMKCFAGEEEKSELIAIMKKNDIEAENEKRSKYNPDEIFKNDSITTIDELKESTNMIPISNKNKWYMNILQKIKNFFKKFL